MRGLAYFWGFWGIFSGYICHAQPPRPPTGSTLPPAFGTRYAIAIYMPNKNEKKSIKSEKNT